MRQIDADAFYKAVYDEVFEKDYAGMYRWDSGLWIRFKLFEQMLRKQPTLEAEPRWIPCSERLPEECEEVNITWVNTDPEPYYANIKGKPFTGCGLYCRGRWFWYSVNCEEYLEEYGFSQGDEMDDAIKVIAWMPLPEPYREVEE